MRKLLKVYIKAKPLLSPILGQMVHLVHGELPYRIILNRIVCYAKLLFRYEAKPSDTP